MPSFLKNSKKNKTASADNTPAQTPRTSIHLSSPSDMTGILNYKTNSHKQIDLALQKSTIGHMQAMSLSRI
ncbi:hypothetical protein EMPS_05894 [Entomortierella parvispora]|uniref:Uncharacterized protein n=1 Tax=Entomortierella parvispora TaxID=205924 RepID=A0A9P3HBA7_9FUNG|nr:hypothetical protein EMPS_05894 [Entomortierella parvispora]